MAGNPKERASPGSERPTILTFEQFWALADGQPGPMSAESARPTEQALDSLAKYRSIQLLEDLGALVPDQLIPFLEGRDDIYHHYVVRVSAENL